MRGGYFLVFGNFASQNFNSLQGDTTTESWLDHANPIWAGHGTESDPFIIDSAEKFAGLALNVKSGNSYDGTYGRYFKQTANIDLSAYVWPGVGNKANPFAGVYDGDFFSISGVKMIADKNSDEENFGLFNNLNEAILTKIHIKESSFIVTVENARACVLVGASANSQISKIISENNVLTTSVDNGYLSTLCNYTENTSISDCIVKNNKVVAFTSNNWIFGISEMANISNCMLIGQTYITSDKSNCYAIDRWGNAKASFGEFFEMKSTGQITITKTLAGSESSFTDWIYEQGVGEYPIQKSLSWYSDFSTSTSKNVYDRLKELGF